MIRRKVVYDADANTDFLRLFQWLAQVSSPGIALRFVERLEARISNLDIGSLRGAARDDIAPGLRIVPIGRRVVVAIRVTATDVLVLRLFYGGQDWEGELMGRSDPDEDDLDD